MPRLTKRGEGGHAYSPECFKEPCGRCGCKKENCEFLTRVCEVLCRYEETGLTPEGVELMMLGGSMRGKVET